MSRRVVVAMPAVALLLAAGCAGTTVREEPGDVAPTSAKPTKPQPRRTIVHTARSYGIGDTASIEAQAGVALRLTATGPRVSSERLSASYGYPPARGHYVTFPVTVVNTGQRPVAIGPQNFFVRTSRGVRVASNDGNAPYSGAARQLDPTELGPGERLRAPLTFDVGVVHGRLCYAPDGSPAVVWRY